MQLLVIFPTWAPEACRSDCSTKQTVRQVHLMNFIMDFLNGLRHHLHLVAEASDFLKRPTDRLISRSVDSTVQSNLIDFEVVPLKIDPRRRA